MARDLTDVNNRLENERAHLIEVARDLGLPRLLDAIDDGVVDDEQVMDAAIEDLHAEYPRISRARLRHAFTAGVLASRWLHVVRFTAGSSLAPDVEGEQ